MILKNKIKNMASNKTLAGGYGVETDSSELQVSANGSGKEIAFRTDGVKRVRIDDEDFRTEAFNPGMTRVTIGGTTYQMDSSTKGSLFIASASTAGEVKLPALVGLNDGRTFKIINSSFGTDTFEVKSQVFSALVGKVRPGQSLLCTVNDSTNAVSGWSAHILGEQKIDVNDPTYTVELQNQIYSGPTPTGVWAPCIIATLSQNSWHTKLERDGNTPVYLVHVDFQFSVVSTPPSGGSPARIILPTTASTQVTLAIVPVFLKFGGSELTIEGELLQGTNYLNFTSEDFSGANTSIRAYFEYLSDTKPT